MNMILGSISFPPTSVIRKHKYQTIPSGSVGTLDEFDFGIHLIPTNKQNKKTQISVVLGLWMILGSISFPTSLIKTRISNNPTWWPLGSWRSGCQCRRPLVLLQRDQWVSDSVGAQELARTFAEDWKCRHCGYPPVNSLRFARQWWSPVLTLLHINQDSELLAHWLGFWDEPFLHKILWPYP